jgi:hypothetical protein
MILSAKLIHNRITNLTRAKKAASPRRQRKKKYIQHQGGLTKGAVEDTLAQRKTNQQIAHKERQGGEQSGTSRQSIVRCTRCREHRHNSCTCKKDTVATVYSTLLISISRLVALLRYTPAEVGKVSGVFDSFVQHVRRLGIL